MPKLFIAIRKKGSKRFLGAIPAKKGSTPSKLKDSLKRMRKSFSARIVTESQLRKIIISQSPGKRPVKRRLKRRKR